MSAFTCFKWSLTIEIESSLEVLLHSCSGNKALARKAMDYLLASEESAQKLLKEAKEQKEKWDIFIAASSYIYQLIYEPREEFFEDSKQFFPENPKLCHVVKTIFEDLKKNKFKSWLKF